MNGNAGVVAAIDLGASSGRIVLGHVERGAVRLEEVLRFANGPVPGAGAGRPRLIWDIERIFVSVDSGLRRAASSRPLSVGVDSWGVDYGLIRGTGLAHPPFHYRDSRTADLETVRDPSTWPAQYRATGVLPQPINTSNQLQDDVRTGRLDDTDTVLFIPDLVRWRLTETRLTESTIASTSGLLGLDGTWATAMLNLTGVPGTIMPPIVNPGTPVGTLTPARAGATGLPTTTQVIAVAGHDTASAIAATPELDGSGAYVSCGTWGLVGIELDGPVVSAASLRSGFTNERGIDGTVLFQRNLTGLWVVNRCLESWGYRPGSSDARRLIEIAQSRPAANHLLDISDPRFASAADMPTMITSWFTERDMSSPSAPPDTLRMLIESIAQAFAGAITEASALTRRTLSHISFTGGGSQIRLLVQELADRAGLPIVAGPVEATALGNVLVQARSLGIITGDRFDLRRIAASSTRVARYEPRPTPAKR